ncbi:hypothetical protein PQX77_017625 [Marasmius sp. AFHP31]|nr:hypothetical protein PQX77_017625 [Marasmius sp. AFHP31]
MSSDTPPARKRTRSSRKSTSSQTQRSRSPTPAVSQSSLANLALPVAPALKEIAGESADELKWKEKSEQAGLGTKPSGDVEVRDTDAASSDPTSAKEALPHATDRDEGEDRLNMDTGTGEQTPLDATKAKNHTGNEDAGDGGSDSPRPTLEKSWEVITKEVTALDEGLVGGWKEDIDTLLVFAGLFSAVVTAFVIESYQWLQEAPEDTTVALLKQISQQLNNTSEPVPEPDTFTVSSSVVAINVLWFLSLIIALVDALFALLCKQWLREHRRHTHTRTPSEALALRWLRNQSLEKWHVPTILASLPMLLEFALFLFLAGLLELLRTRHPVPFAIATIVVALTALFYFGTTIIPTVDIIRQARQVTEGLRYTRKRPDKDVYPPVDFIMTLPPMEYICPYKSPQAWAVLQVLRFVSRNLDWDHIVQETICSLSDWSSVDLELLQRSSIKLAPPFYELDAFRWLVAELRDSPHMIPHLRNILSTFPLHLVMPAVLDQWFFLPRRKWAVSDIEAALMAPDPPLAFDLPSSGIEGHLTRAKREFLTRERQTGHFRRLLHWTHVSNGSGRDSPPPFSTPFESIDANPDDDLRGRLWDIYTEIIESQAATDYLMGIVVEDLAPHIIASSTDYALHLPTATTTSSFVESAASRDFLSNVHNTIIERAFNRKSIGLKHHLVWTEAMDIVRRVHKFPEDHFRVIPGHFSLSLIKLKKTLDALSPTDLEIDFGYLDSFSGGWGNAHSWPKKALVEFLSEHINDYPQSNADSSHSPDKSQISPLVMSSAGLELITFVNNRLAEERVIWTDWLRRSRTTWRDAIERVRVARPELPPDHFKHIFHEGCDDPPAPHELASRQKAQAENSSGNPRDITDTGEVDRDKQMEGCSDSKSSLQPKLGELNERGLHVEDGDTHKQGNIPRQAVATVGPASGSGAGSLRGKMIGGPDADKNV